MNWLKPVLWVGSILVLTSCLPAEDPKSSQSKNSDEGSDANKVATSSQKDVAVLPICVLDYNLPFSQSTPDSQSGLRGIYLDLAEALAEEREKELSVHYVMYAFYSRPARHGLLMDNCDLQVGLPRTEGDYMMGRKVALSKAFMRVGYAIVASKDKSISSLSDLNGLTVAIQAGSPPQEEMLDYPDVKTTLIKDPDPAFEMLEDGSIDAAFIWGPSAGFLNKYQYNGKYQVLPTAYQWPVAIGMRGEDIDMKEELDHQLSRLEPLIRKLREDYGFPQGKPIAVNRMPD